MFRSIRSRMLLGFLLVWSVAVVTAAAGLTASMSSQSYAREIGDSVVDHMVVVSGLQSAALGYHAELAEMALALQAGDLAAADASARDAVRMHQRVDASFVRLDSLKQSHADRSFVDAERTAQRAWDEVVADAGALVVSYDRQYGTRLAAVLGQPGETTASVRTLDFVDTDRERFESLVSNLNTLHYNEAQDLLARSETELRRQMLVQIAVVIAGLVFSAVTALGIHRSVARPLALAAAHADSIREGHLHERLDDPGLSEVASMTRALEAMKSSLVGRIDDLREVVEALARAGERTTRATEMIVSTSIEVSSADCSRSEAASRMREAGAGIARESARLKELTLRANAILAETDTEEADPEGASAPPAT